MNPGDLLMYKNGAGILIIIKEIGPDAYDVLAPDGKVYRLRWASDRVEIIK